MVQEQKRPQQKKMEESKPEQTSSDDPILRKLRYPDKGEYRVKYKEDELVIAAEEDRN